MAPPAQERIVFATMIESFMKGLGPLVTPATLEELKRAGLKLDKPPPAYPEQQMLQFIDIFSRHAFPHLERSERLRRMGFAAIKGWQSTFLGSAVAGLMRVVGPKRSLPQLGKAFKTTNNFSEATFQLVGDTEALVTVNDVQGMPTYWQGVFEAGMQILDLEGSTVTIEREAPGPDATFRFRW